MDRSAFIEPGVFFLGCEILFFVDLPYRIPVPINRSCQWLEKPHVYRKIVAQISKLPPMLKRQTPKQMTDRNEENIS
ncbi:MAG: hypothetical protein IPN79_04620 [Saprospiraceae bacterium]|nr:hypothetical protein [Saprospiraceae bacterium]